jgi:3-dehydroquinate dehydratase-2
MKRPLSLLARQTRTDADILSADYLRVSAVKLRKEGKAMPDKSRQKRILAIHGPNLNMLGKRETHIYGHESLAEIDARLKEKGKELDIDVETFQSNYEGAIVDKVQQAAGSVHGVVINPAAYTHTSIAIRDALAMLDIPLVEIHLSNIYRREPFRHPSMIADIVAARIVGFGSQGYILALEGLVGMLSKRA